MSEFTLKQNLANLVRYQKVDVKDLVFTTGEFQTRENYKISRFAISNANAEEIPGYLLLPLEGQPPYPTMICLQGHSPGMHISIGEAKTARDSISISGGRDLAIQAVNNGWAAVVIELKGFGERAVEKVSCNDLSLRELMLGNTMLGHRTKEVSMAVDYILSRPELDAHQIGCIGNSSGGTTSYFAACLDDRINLTVVSCSFATYASSWLKHHHCACGYILDIMKVGDMPDFAKLIAARKLIIIGGKHDPIADIEGVRTGVEIARKAYQSKKSEANLVYLEGEKGHQFYPQLAWPAINKISTID